MSLRVDQKEIERAREILRNTITQDKAIPEEAKFKAGMEFGIEKKITISGKQLSFSGKLKTGYYKNKPEQLRKDLEAINFTLQWGTLTNTDFSGLDLSGVDFSACRLDGSKLKNCNLSNSRLVFVSAQNSDFSMANLAGVSIAGSSIKGTIFESITEKGSEGVGKKYREGKTGTDYNATRSSGGYLGSDKEHVYGSKASPYIKRKGYLEK